MRGTIGLATVLVGLLLLPAGVAQADDNSVYGAYVSQDAAFRKLGKQFRRGLRTWKRSHYKNADPAVKALSGSIDKLREVDILLAAEEASTDHGRRAKAEALASVRLLRRATTALRKGIRELTARKPKAALRHARQSRRLLKKAAAAETRARREFRAAGIQVDPGAGP
jgi:hypothetical protein